MADKAGNDDYQLMPINEIKKLKREIDYLKQGSPAAASTEEFVSSTNKLTEKIESLLAIFNDATEEMRKEDKESHLLSERIEPLLEKIDILLDQNRKIAKGLVVTADLVNGIKEQQKIKVVRKEELEEEEEHHEETPVKNPLPSQPAPFGPRQGFSDFPPIRPTMGMPPQQGMKPSEPSLPFGETPSFGSKEMPPLPSLDMPPEMPNIEPLGMPPGMPPQFGPQKREEKGVFGMFKKK